MDGQSRATRRSPVSSGWGFTGCGFLTQPMLPVSITMRRTSHLDCAEHNMTARPEIPTQLAAVGSEVYLVVVQQIGEPELARHSGFQRRFLRLVSLVC